MYIENLTGEILTIALRETEFDYHDESYQNSVFGYFGPPDSGCKGLNALVSNQVAFYEYKKTD